MTHAPSFPLRRGDRPETSKDGPHRQLTQKAPPSVWGELVAKVFMVDGVVQGHSTVSMADSMAGIMLELPREHGVWSLAIQGPVEPFHIHGVTDTSIHIALPSERAVEVISQGWGEVHPYADFDTQIMLYAPRSNDEIDMIVGLVVESVEFARSSLLST